MTKQQIVNRVYEVFIRDGNKASMKGHNCYYGHPEEGHGCAVACLMSRNVRLKLYEEESNNGSFSAGDGLKKGIIPKSFDKHSDLLSALQVWHDEVNCKSKRLNTKQKIEYFKVICTDCGIRYPGDM